MLWFLIQQLDFAFNNSLNNIPKSAAEMKLPVHEGCFYISSFMALNKQAHRLYKQAAGGLGQKNHSWYEQSSWMYAPVLKDTAVFFIFQKLCQKNQRI